MTVGVITILVIQSFGSARTIWCICQNACFKGI